MANFAVILPAAGKSSRFHNPHYKKPFAPLANRAVWLHAADRFLNRSDVKQVIVVISKEDREFFDLKFASNVLIMGIDVVDGGAERSDSIANALVKLKPECDYVAIHDAARPCLADAWITQVFDAAEKSGAAILANPVTATLKRVQGERIVETVSRENLWEAQTPQVFRRQLLVDAYAQRAKFNATDDAQLIERFGQPVTVVPGSPINLKITTNEDLRLAEQALKAIPKASGFSAANPFADDRWT